MSAASPAYAFFADVVPIFEATAEVAGLDRASALVENPDSSESFACRVARIRFLVRSIGGKYGLILWAPQEQTTFDVTPFELARRVFAYLPTLDHLQQGERCQEMPLSAFTDDGSHLRSLGIAVPW